MAGKKPLFVSAPRLILGIENDQGVFCRLGYAIGLSLRISVNVQPITVMGSFAPIGYEPVMYQPVQLTMQIIKLQKKLTRDARVQAAKNLYATDNFVDSNNIRQNADLYSFSPDTITNEDKTNTTITKLNTSNTIMDQADIFKHLDPLNILQSKTFDVVIYLNVNGFGDNLSTTEVNSFGSTNKITSVNTASLVQFMRIEDCRLTSRNVNIQVGQLLNEPVTAMGLLAIHNGEELDSVIKEGAAT